MKKLFLYLLVCSGLLLNAQTTPLHYAHNPANAGVNNLFFHDNLCHKFLFIYTQAEIAAMTTPVSGPVLIDTIWFRHGGGSSQPTTVLSNLVITLGHTTLAVPVANFATNFNTGAPVVVLNTPALSYTPLNGAWNQPNNNWTYIALQIPFAYNFTDNLAVQFEFSASSGFVIGHYADNGGIPITQYDLQNTATVAGSTTARPMFGISPGCGAPVSLGPDSTVCGSGSVPLGTSIPNATYLWNTGATTPTITVTSSGTYWLSVTDSCGTRSDSVNIVFNPLPQTDAGADQTICAGSALQLQASGGTSYSWAPAAGLSNPNSSNPTATPLTTTTYVVTATANGCSTTDTVIVNVNPLPPLVVSADTTIVLGGSVTLNASGSAVYAWQPPAGLSCANCPSPVATPTVTTTYTVTTTDANGCSSSDTVRVTVDIRCGDVFVPNAFSPDNNSTNDRLCVYGNCISEMVFTVFDRWGNKVFESNAKTDCWDGTVNGIAANTGIFVYQLNATLVNGQTVNRKGTIHLVR